MIYVVTHTSRSGRTQFCANNQGLFRHTAKYDAERTLKRHEGQRDNLTLRQFKTMDEAATWAMEQNAALC